MKTDLIKINKDVLDYCYNEQFDIDHFKKIDPCGVVYKLLEHTSYQLDIELGALFIAMISWGSRKVIYPTALNMIENEMAWHPASFILDRKYLDSYKNAKNQCVYRTLNTKAFKQVCENIFTVLTTYNDDKITLEKIFDGRSTKDIINDICYWLSPARVGTVNKSACKRICMYVRWMTRPSIPDLGIWKTRLQNDLYAVMDVHVCKLTKDLLHNKRPSWNTCVELTNIFKKWNKDDPLRYDIALMTLSDRLENNDVDFSNKVKYS